MFAAASVGFGGHPWIAFAGAAFLEFLDITFRQLQIREVLQPRRIADAPCYLKSISLFQTLDVVYCLNVLAYRSIDPRRSKNPDFAIIRLERLRHRLTSL